MVSTKRVSPVVLVAVRSKVLVAAVFPDRESLGTMLLTTKVLALADDPWSVVAPTKVMVLAVPKTAVEDVAPIVAVTAGWDCRSMTWAVLVEEHPLPQVIEMAPGEVVVTEYVSPGADIKAVIPLKLEFWEEVPKVPLPAPVMSVVTVEVAAVRSKVLVAVPPPVKM